MISPFAFCHYVYYHWR